MSPCALLGRARDAEGADGTRRRCAQVYYYNTLTNESAWAKPEGFQGDAARASAQPTPVATERVAGTSWSQVTCDDGKKYYYNMRSMARPPLLLAPAAG